MTKDFKDETVDFVPHSHHPTVAKIHSFHFNHLWYVFGATDRNQGCATTATF